MQIASSFKLLAIAAAFLAAPAHAVTGLATASITDLQLQLIDLDPNDGIIPSIVFDRTNHSAYTSSFSAGRYEHVDTYGSTAVELPHGGGAASVSATGLNARSYYSSGAHGHQVHHTGADSQRDFTLSPSTGLLVTAKGAIHTDYEGAEWGRSYLGLLLSLESASEIAEGGLHQSLRYGTSNGSRDYNLSIYLATGTVAQQGTLYLQTSTLLNYYAPVTPPVPEPATWGLLLAGAAIVGARLRRHGS